jgi:hypothetical protein
MGDARGGCVLRPFDKLGVNGLGYATDLGGGGTEGPYMSTHSVFYEKAKKGERLFFLSFFSLMKRSKNHPTT